MNTHVLRTAIARIKACESISPIDGSLNRRNPKPVQDSWQQIKRLEHQLQPKQPVDVLEFCKLISSTFDVEGFRFFTKMMNFDL